MYLPALALHTLAAVAVVSGLLVLSHFLGQRHAERGTAVPYESGMPTTRSARAPLSIKYYLIAVFFVLFDLEVALILAWALVAREVGWAGFAQISVFIFVLLIALFYVVRTGALDWGTRPRRRRRA